MSTLRKAAEAALEALEAGRDTPTSRAAIDALRAALAEPMTPAAWASPNEHGDLVTLWFSRSEAAAYCEEGEEPVPLYAAPPQPKASAETVQQEPVAQTPRQRELLAFLDGSGPLDGVWFDTRYEDRQPFWWRAALREAFAAPPQPREPVPGARWYAVSRDGAATLCVDEDDARQVAEESSGLYPHLAPYRAVQLVEAREPVRLTEEQIETMWRDEWDGFVSFEEAAVIVRDVEDATLRAQGIEP